MRDTATMISQEFAELFKASGLKLLKVHPT